MADTDAASVAALKALETGVKARLKTSSVDAANGVAGLDANGKLATSKLGASADVLLMLGAADNATIRSRIGATNLTLGTTAGTAKPGDWQPGTNNVVGLDAALNGKADAAAMTTALAGKLTSPTANAIDGKVLGRVAGAPAWVDPPAAGTASAAPSMAAERIAARLQTGTGDLTVAVASDSTANDGSDWIRLWVEAEKLRRGTALRIEYLNWVVANNAYTETVVQAGENQTPPAGAAMTDNFNRTGEIVGSTSSGGQVWSGATGGWTGDGSKAVNTAARNISYNCGSIDGAFEIDFIITTGPPPATTQTHRIYTGAVASGLANGVWISLSVNTSGGSVFSVHKTIGGVTTTLLASTGTGLTSNSATPQTLKIKIIQAIQNITVETTANGGTKVVHTPTPITESDYATLGNWRGISSQGAITSMPVDNIVMTNPEQPATYRKMRILNAAVGGASLSYQQSRIATMYPPTESIDVMIIASGHNYATDSAATYIAAVDSFVADYTAAHPESDILYSTQNPQYAPASYVTQHKLRQVAGRLHAKEKGWSYLPALERFEAANDSGLVSPDGVHPTTPATIELLPGYGSTLWANLMAELISEHESLIAGTATIADVTYEEDPA